MAAKIAGFFGEYRWLSNFWMVPIPFEAITFPSSEHAYQAAKSQDPKIWAEVAALPTPGQAKRYGLMNINLPKGWDDQKIEVMRMILNVKFSHPDLRQKLIDTGDAELIEANYWGDSFWGFDNKRGFGQNNLGKLLMEIRSTL